VKIEFHKIYLYRIKIKYKMKKYTLSVMLLSTLMSCATGLAGTEELKSKNENEKSMSVEEEIKTKTISIKKGQSVDFLVGVMNPEAGKMQEEYFQNIMPVAMKNGFKSELQMLVSQPTVSGKFDAAFGGLMTWPNPESRVEFRNDMKNNPYDYLSYRKKIWPVFNLIEHDNLDQDYEFTVSSDKIYVITTYWIKDESTFNVKKADTPSNIEKAGGEFLITLSDGKAPKGNYEPNYISITEWSSIASFEAYLKTGDNSIKNSGISKSNQWVTNLLFF